MVYDYQCIYNFGVVPLRLPIIIQYRLDYIGLNGGIRGSAIFAKVVLLTLYVLYLVLVVARLKYTYDGHALGQVTPPGDTEFLIKFCLAASVIASWTALFYFLMALDGSGPFVIILYRILITDIPFFLVYYSIVLAGFASAISMLRVNAVGGVGIDFLNCVWELFQAALDMFKDLETITYDSVDEKFKSFYDFFITLYYLLVVLLLLNLLIGMVSYTYDLEKARSIPNVLLEKYNILCSEERYLRTWDNVGNVIKGFFKRTFFSNHQDYLEKSYIGFILKGLGLDGNGLHRFRNKYSMHSDAGNQIEIIDREEDWWTTETIESEDLTEGTNRDRNILLIIDPQIDFHENGGEGGEGSLCVLNSDKDAERIAKLIRGHEDESEGGHSQGTDTKCLYDLVDDILITQDSHYLNDIGHQNFWVSGIKKKDGELEAPIHPPPFTSITYNDVMMGKWLPTDLKYIHWVKYYTFMLEESQRKALAVAADEDDDDVGISKLTCTVWPDHCLIGTKGHAVVPTIHDAVLEWSKAKNLSAHYFPKGQSGLTEMYSAVRAEVPIPRLADEIKKAFDLHDFTATTNKDRKSIFYSAEELEEMEANFMLRQTNEEAGCKKLGLKYMFDERTIEKRIKDLKKLEKKAEDNKDAYFPLEDNASASLSASEMLAKLRKASVLDEDDTHEMTAHNKRLLSHIYHADKLLVCGQALSHCVNYTLRDIVKYWPKSRDKIVILKDAMSSVKGYEAEGKKFLSDMEYLGCTVTTVSDFMRKDSTPYVKKIEPQSGEGGIEGLITGENFIVGSTKVFFGDKFCKIVTMTPSVIVYTIPEQTHEVNESCSIRIVCNNIEQTHYKGSSEQLKYVYRKKTLS